MEYQIFGVFELIKFFQEYSEVTLISNNVKIKIRENHFKRHYKGRQNRKKCIINVKNFKKIYRFNYIRNQRRDIIRKDKIWSFN